MALQNIGGTTTRSGISRITTEYLYWTITTDSDLTGATAEVAFEALETDKPIATDWVAAELVETPGDPTTTSVRILVGPDGGDKDLTPQTTEQVTYYVWIRITSGVERITRRAGTLLVR